MSEERELTRDLPDSVLQQIQQIVKQNPSLTGNNVQELETVLRSLAALPFKDEVQQASFLEHVQRLQGYHIIQLFNFGVTPLQKSLAESPAKFLEEVIKLFEICLTFCYTTDVSKQVSFDYYVRALKFCFRLEPNQCLPTKVVSNLLELVKICQEVGLSEIVSEKTEQEANPSLKIHGPSYFFADLLQILEARRHEECFNDITEQTVRFAAADAKIKCIQGHEIGERTLQSEHVVSPVLLTNWMKLLKLKNVSNGFAFSLAKADSLRLNRTEQIIPFLFGGVVLHTSTYQSTVCFFVQVLEELQRNGIDVCLPDDEERLEIFFSHLNHFCDHPNLAPTSIKLLAATSISNETLKDVLQQFFYKEGTDFNTKEAFDLIFKVLSLLPDGELVKKTLAFWREVFGDDPGHQTLACLLALLDVEESSDEKADLQEKARITLNFIEWKLPRHILPLISLWQGFLSLFIKIFPTTFQSSPEVLDFINRTLQAAQMSAKEHEAYVAFEQVPSLQLLEWLSRQNCTEERKSEMVRLLMCSTEKAGSRNWILDTGVIRILGLCPRLQFGTKSHVVRELNSLASFLKNSEKRFFKVFIEDVASNETLECMDEILHEFLDFMERFVDKRTPKTIPEYILELLSLLSKVSISGERRVKVIQLSKKSGKDLLLSLRILQLINKYNLKEMANDYFDLLFAALLETLKGDDHLCEQLFKQHQCYFPSIDVLKVWTSSVAELISSGLFKEEIDLQCCCPVLQQAFGFCDPSEISQLLTQVRSTAAKIVHLSRERQKECSSTSNARRASHENTTEETEPLGNFVASVTTILNTEVLSSGEKLELVKNVSDAIISAPHILTTLNLITAFRNLIPCYPTLQGTTSSSSEDTKKFNYIKATITTLLENPTALGQLSRISESARHNFLFDVLPKNMSSLFCKDILLFIGSLKDFDQAFFDNLVSFLEGTIRESMSSEDVLEVLQELVQVLRNIRSEMIPMTMFNFASLFQKSVGKQERDVFLSEVATRWDMPPNHQVLLFLEVPLLLWKAYNTASTPETRYEMISRLQKILTKSSQVEDWVKSEFPWFASFVRQEECIRRRIACCELEWLVLHSSLSTEDAALAFDLSCFSFQRVYHHNLECFNFPDVHISKDGVFKIVPQENTTASKVGVPEKDTGSASGVAMASTFTGNSPLASEPQKPILTPVLVAKELIHHLRRVLGQDKELPESAFSLWNLVFNSNKPLTWCETECVSNCPVLDDYVYVFLSILAEASSKEIMFHWARLDQHHVCQCSEVILKACKWNRDDNDEEVLMKLQCVVSTTLEILRLNTRQASTTPWTLSFVVPCFRHLRPQLKHMSKILERRFPFEVTTRVLELHQSSLQAGVAVGEIISLWSSKQQSLELVEEVQSFCKGDEMASLNPAQSEFAWQLLRAFGRFCMNSSKVLLNKFKELIVLYDPEDAYGLNRLPKWREMMIADGFPAGAIDSWCAAFLMTPLEDLTSRDVDAIVDLHSRSLELVTSVSQIIQQCIFPNDGFEVTQGEGIKESQVKERIRLARLLGEFINILKLRKPDENPKDAVVRDIVIDACVELCKSHENIHRRRNDLYKIHGQKLKALFTEIFGKRRKGEDGQVSIQDSAVTHQEGEQELRVVASVARQPSYLHENLPMVLSHTHVYEPMLVLLRRWLSGINKKPTLASYTLKIVQLLFSLHPSHVGPELLDELHESIKTCILSLERNRSLIAQLQASGYNQRFEGIPDLWMSHSLELPCYLSKRESLNSRLFTKKLTKVLRRLWNEWKDILFMLGIVSIKVGEDEMCTKDLFGVQAELDEMEEQATAVKEVVKQINSEDLDRRVKELMRLEQRHRASIEKLYKSNKGSMRCDEMKKFVAVWDNRFLEQVKMCSERIPGCYAPNGFHSEKPVLCALSVDNRILTVFKEEKPGRREEIENVEVKLFAAGLYVYGLHPSGHDYVTDELWAAFYKMLLEDGLVPRIVLSNESPGFDWIKTFVKPATSHPCPWKWELHHGIVPREEDYFDYQPLTAALWPALRGLTEFITLTKENVSSFKFSDFKDANVVEDRERQIKEIAKKAIQELQHELHLMHGDNDRIRKGLAGKLRHAVKETVKGMVHGVQPTEETVRNLIDMEKLAFGHPEVERTEESRQQYAAAVLRACEHARTRHI